MPSKPKRSTQTRATRSISSKVRSSDRGQPVHALFGHAVGAAEVAAVGDRDAQVATVRPCGSTRAVDQPAYAETSSPRQSTTDQPARSTSPPGSDPSPSGTMARASARAMARSRLEPGRPRSGLAAAVGAPARRRPGPDGSCRRGGGARPSSATARIRGRSQVGLGHAHHPAQGRPGEQLVADHGRHRVAGQAEHRRAADHAEGERLGRADGHLHPVHVARCSSSTFLT